MNRAILLIITLIFSAWTVKSGSQVSMNQTFKEGEFVKLKIHYGFINAGYATLEVAPNLVQINGRPCYHLKGRGFTNSVFDKVYRVRDSYVSYFDQKKHYSHLFQRTIEEGSFRSYSETHFDHDHNIARYYGRDKKEKVFPIQAGIQDVISAYYNARMSYDAKQLQVGDKLSLRNFIDRKTVDLEAIVLKKETIKVEGRKFKTLKLKLTVEESGMITDGAKLTLWVSDDENKIPVRFKSSLVIGSLKADLVEWDNLSNPFDALIEE